MGGSMGSAIAQGMALRRPDRVRSLIAAMGGPATAGVLQTFRNINFGIFVKFARLPKAATREQEIENLVSIYRIISSPGYPFPEQWARQAATISHDRHPRDPRTTQRQVAAGRAMKLPPLSTLTVPTLVLAGEDDPLVKLRAARQLAAQVPGSTFVSYPGMGHSLPEELWPDIIAHVDRTTGH
jgi:pimeloyl-ACP methyl ester carboxylesterase